MGSFEPGNTLCLEEPGSHDAANEDLPPANSEFPLQLLRRSVLGRGRYART
ncbi:hypothetical protein Pr1d_01230 [Bythopirellula goksoeyrii]|uniref:Uncharacterized protein n=1 Tax=Bythopirellula goksoeyrii TaxID=1400387 RepID=A0A5B9Q628_9BACT|nr:hypothetical protein Pr1d_01230 [Bythopirellula goksoeyrii]